VIITHKNIAAIALSVAIEVLAIETTAATRRNLRRRMQSASHPNAAVASATA